MCSTLVCVRILEHQRAKAINEAVHEQQRAIMREKPDLQIMASY